MLFAAFFHTNKNTRVESQTTIMTEAKAQRTDVLLVIQYNDYTPEGKFEKTRVDVNLADAKLSGPK